VTILGKEFKTHNRIHKTVSVSTYGTGCFITPQRVSYEESYVKAFPFDKMVPGMLDPEMVEDTAKIVNEAIKDRLQVNPIINNRVGGNAPLIAEKVANRLHSAKQQRLF
jgi:hypothetical protein